MDMPFSSGMYPLIDKHNYRKQCHFNWWHFYKWIQCWFY